jgi:amino acid adenylation domain-containing protein
VKTVAGQIDDSLDLSAFTLFYRQAELLGDNIAVITEGESVTYRELASRADAIGDFLAQRVTQEQTIGVHTARSVDMVAAMLGIWKAGCAYVPLDPDDPPERSRRILEISSCEIVLAHSESSGPNGLFETGHENALVREIVDVRKISTRASALPRTQQRPGGNRLAYVMFTSGSSGAPKGVEVEHRSLVSFLCACRDRIEFTESDCFLAATTIGFDVSIAEIFIPLISGGTVLLRSREILLDPKRLAADITEFGVTVFQAVSTIWSLILEGNPEFPRLRVAINMGEAISNELASKLIPYGEQVWNLYGPTEATVYATAYRITGNSLDSELEPGASAPIGRPLKNATFAVLDPDGQPVRQGQRGELLIGGPQVARGYRNAPALTDEAFVHVDRGAGRMYRTGDVVAVREDGELLFFGRNDDQLSIRGMRVEPGEITASLLDHPAIAQAATTWLAKSNGAPSIVAAISTRADKTVDEANLRDWLGMRLHAQKIPERFLFMQDLPRLPNGKVDYKRIRDDVVTAESKSEPPDTARGPTATESTLIGIWESILNVSPINVTDHFLASGGDSIAAVHLISRVEREFGVSLSFRDVFAALQLNLLAARIDGESKQRPEADFVFPLHEMKGERPLFFADADIRLAGEGRWTVSCPLYGVSHWAQQRDFFKASSIADLARTHVLAIRQIQEFGPYRIAGQEFGGVVALETARQLEAQGQIVEILFLLDPSMPAQVDVSDHLEPEVATPTIARRLYHWIARNRLSNWLTYQFYHLGRPRNTDQVVAQFLPRNRWPSFWGKERWLVKDYVPRACAGPVLAFFTELGDNYNVWMKVFGSDEHFHVLPENEDDLFTGAGRAAWMSALNPWIRPSSPEKVEQNESRTRTPQT